MNDGWRLAVGTLTTLPVRAPSEVTTHTGRTAMMLAPVPGLFLGVLGGVVFGAASVLGTGVLLAAVLAVAALRLGDRAFHLDGLADTADGLAASYDRERALTVMRTGDTGPAGAAALVLVLLVQVTAAARLGDVMAGDGTLTGYLAAAVGVAGCVVISRAMLMVACLRGIPAARQEGLGAVVAGSVRWSSAVVVLVLVSAAFTGALIVAGNVAGTDIRWWAAPVAVLVALVATGVVVRRCVARLGGVTGDVLGAVVEVSLAAGLVGLVAVLG
jgi:adenosylcobinamide-GDP ribazoletransferase